MEMNSPKKTARIAGLLYLIMGLTGAFSMMYIPSRLIEYGDAVATAKNIHAAQFLFRAGIASNLISQALSVFLVLTLYRLFKGVNKNLSALMVILLVVSVPITFVNMLNQVAALLLLTDASFVGTFEADQRNAFMMLFINLFSNGILVAEVFWGLWLFPFGLLVFRSGFIPRVIGILLIAGCFAYVIDSFTGLLFMTFRNAIVPFLMIPLSVGEFSIILWMLIIGVKTPKAVPVAIHVNSELK